nr:LuxR C-terminal-related transcriptional regulator [Halobacillus salinus]
MEDERERAVLECLLDGMSMVAIGHHMGLSRRHVYNLKGNIVFAFSKGRI